MSLKTVAQFTSGGGGGSGTVTSVNVSGGTTGLTTSGGPVTTSGTITMAGTLAVANGGTGVTASTGASSVALRDANVNLTVNSIFEGFTSVAAAGTTTTLTASSAPTYLVTGSGGQTFQLPDATTLPAGAIFSFNNNQTSGTVVVKNNTGTTLVTLQSGSFVDVTLLVNSPAAGSWDTHAQAPSNVSWSTNTLSWAGSYTSGTWNGNAIGAIYGGTGQTTVTTGDLLYGSAANTWSKLADVATGSVLISGGVGVAPSWSSAPTVTSITAPTVNSATSLTFQTNGTTTAMTINASQNVGIATSSPSAKLQVIGATTISSQANVAAVIGAGVTSELLLGSINGNTPFIASQGAYPLAFFTNATEAMRIDSSGNLLVGATSLSTSNTGFFVAPANGGAGVPGIYNQGASSSAGNTYHVYSTTASAYRFYVSYGGVINATNTTISAISDQRLKENIVDLDMGLDKIMLLKPRKFDWKVGKGKDIKDDRGFIAQEFEQVFPDLVDEWLDPAPEGEEPYKSVRADLIPILVKAIQELSAKNNALEARLAKLETV